MKKIFFLILFCTINMMLFAQKNRHVRDNSVPPPVVEKSYQKDYSNVNHENWDMKNNQWHTRYTDRDHGNRAVDVYYDRSGRRMQSQSSWDRNDLPVAVRDRMKRRYHDENYEVLRIEKPGRGFFFQLTLGGNRKVYMDERGHEVHY